MDRNNPRARGAVQNEQVCGIVCDYKQIFGDKEASYALFPPNFKHSENCLRDEAIASLIFEIYIFK